MECVYIFTTTAANNVLNGLLISSPPFLFVINQFNYFIYHLLTFFLHNTPPLKKTTIKNAACFGPTAKTRNKKFLN